ncbi:MAG: hypothetical protein EA383_13605 [Spirochaetaceae bacterium]|nr:MAG: hypothetical protein EA383_13605 [Spirochaetaceae bacterium]
MKRSNLVRTVISLATLMAILSCQNPFDVGLGDNVDIEPPRIRLLSPESGGFLRDTVTFEGFATDDTGIQRVEIKLNRGEWRTIPSSRLQITSSGNRIRADWTYEVDTLSFSTSRLWVQLRATDKAGRQTESDELSFNLDNDAPAIIFTFPSLDPNNAPAGEAADFWFTANIDDPPLMGSVGKGGRIYGTTFDREAVETGFPRYQLWLRSEDQPSGWTVVDNRNDGEAPVDVVDFSIPVPSDPGGDYLLRIQSQDVGGQQRLLGPYVVQVVEGAPVVQISDPGQNDFVAGGSVQIQGTMSHESGDQPALALTLVPAGGADSVSVGAGDISVTGPDGAGLFDWEYSFDSSQFADGTVTVEARAQMSGGDVVVPGFASVAVTVDNAAPTVTFASPSSASIVNSEVTVGGNAGDNYIVDLVERRITGDAITDTPWEPVDSGTTSWSFSFDSTVFSAVGDPAVAITVEVRSTDRAGNVSAVQTRALTVDQDSDLPTIEFTNIDSETVVYSENVISASTELRLNLADDDAVQINTLQYRFRRRIASDPDEFTAWTDWLIVDSEDSRTQTQFNDYRVTLRDAADALLGDGLYQVEFWVEDINGTGLSHAGVAGKDDGGASRVYLAVNSGPPTITLDPGIHNSYRNGTFAVSGAVTDPAVGLEYIRLRYDGTTISDLAGAGATELSFSFDVDPDVDLAGTDGVFDMTLVARSFSGEDRERTVSVTIDTVAPEISSFSVAPVVEIGGTDFVNGTIQVGPVVVSDDNAMQQSDPVKWWLLPSADPPVDSYEHPDGTSFGSSPYSVSIDTQDFSDETEYTLWIVARDRAGNDTVVSREVEIDQSTDSPIITFSSPAPDGSTQYTGSGSMDATGTVQDVDGLALLQRRFPGETEWTTIAEWTENWPTSYSWTVDLSSLQDGSGITFEMRAEDRKGETAFSTVEVESPAFRISTSSPTVSIDAPSTGAFFNGETPISASGSADIDSATATITEIAYRWGQPGDWTGEWAPVTFDPESPAPGESVTWNHDIDIPAGSPEGVVRLNVRATADNARSGTAVREIRVDTTPPTISFSAPADAAVVNGIFTVHGSAGDDNTVDRVAVEVIDASDVVILENDDVGRFSWSYDVNSVDDLLDGASYTIRATAFDGAGNATVAERTITVDQSTDTPTVSFSNLALDGSSIFLSDASIAGTATDDDGVEYVEYRFNATGEWTRLDKSGGTSENFSIPLGGLDEGSHEIVVRVRDTAGFAAGFFESGPIEFKLDVNPPTVTIDTPLGGSSHSADFTVTGEAADAVGISEVRYRVHSGDWTTASFDSDTGVWIAYVEVAGLPEGEVTFRVRAENNNGRTQDETRSFIVDTTPPSISVTSPSAGSTVNRTITLSGTTQDENSNVTEVAAYIVSAADGSLIEVDTVTAVNITAWEMDLDTAQLTEPGGSWPGAAEETAPDSGVWDVTVRIMAVDGGGNSAFHDVSFQVDQSQNRPVISFTNLAADILFESTGSVSGTITDDDGVDYIEYRFRPNRSDPWSNWEHIDLGGGTTETFSFPYSALGDGFHEVEVRARDILPEHPDFGALESFAETGPIPFKIDTLPPVLEVSTPVNNSFWNTDLLVVGVASDASGIDTVRVRIGSGTWVDADLTDIGSGGADFSDVEYSVTLPVAGLTEGLHNVTIEAADTVGKTTSITRAFTYDVTPPQVGVLTPDNGVNVNSRVTLRGTSTDDNGIVSTEYKIGKSDTADWIEFTNRFNWEHIFLNIDQFGNDIDATETAPGSNIWQLPIYIRATDPAGNVTEIGGVGTGPTDYYLTVDPAGDNPEAIILQPGDGETVGGRIRVSGAAEDDDAVYRVEIAFDMNNDGTFSGAGDVWPEPDGGWPIGEEPVLSNVIADPDTTQWYRVNDNTSGGTWANWSIDLNKYGEFNPPDGELRTIRIQVRAIDTKDGAAPGVAGNTEIITVTIDPNVPSIEDLNFDNGDTVGGPIELAGTVRDTSKIDFLRVRASGGGLTENIILINNNIIQQPDWITEVTGVEGEEYTIHLPLNSLDYFGPGSTGLWSFNIEADDGQFSSQRFFTLQVDNRPPAGELDPFLQTIQVTGTDYIQVSGSEYVLQGTATDTGTVSGVDAVTVWARRDTQVFDLRWDAYPYVDRLSPTGLVAAGDAVDGSRYAIAEIGTSDFTAIGASRNEVGAVFEATGSTTGTGLLVPEPYFAVVDRFNEEGDDSVVGKGDQDGIRENIRLSAGAYEWYVIFDSYTIPDGPFDIHYAVRDIGGNHTAYSDAAFVANRRPEINAIELGTDLTGAGNVNYSEEYVGGFTTTNFTVRNFRLQFDVLTQDQSQVNEPLDFVIEFNDGGIWETVYSGENSVIEITDFSSIPDTIEDDQSDLNAALFRITVVDSLGMLTTQEVRLNIDNIDSIPPTIEVSPFGQRYTVSTTDSLKVLAPVADYLENIVTSGSGSSMVRHGHVQYAANAVDYNGGFRDVLSGRVIFTGRAYDNQRVDSLTVTVPGYNGDAPFEIAIWDPNANAGEGGMVSTEGDVSDVASGGEWGFETEPGSESITEANGHVFNWLFALNTAAIDTVAAHDVTISFGVEDTQQAGPASTYSVDIAPYITRMFNPNPLSQGGLSEQVLRTSTGAYVFDFHETNGFRLEGFNLAGAQFRLSDSVIDEPDGAIMTVLDEGPVGNGRRYVDLRKDLPGSGYITAFVNGMASLNNRADNSEQVPFNPRSQQWNDDRYIIVWDLTSVLPAVNNQTFYYPSMVMNGNNPVFSYTDDNTGYSWRTTGDTTNRQLTGRYYQRQTAMSRNADGAFWIASVEDSFIDPNASTGFLTVNRDRTYAAAFGNNPNGATIGIAGLRSHGGLQLNRYLYPRLHVEGPNDASRVYLAYYDAQATQRNIKFAAFRATGNRNDQTNITGRIGADTAVIDQLMTVPGTDMGSSSRFFDMTVRGSLTDADHRVAIAYFNEESSSLVLRWIENPVNAQGQLNASPADWQELIIESEGSFAGTHVSITNDGTDLYLAYYDSSSADLKMARVSGVNWDTVDSVIVDAHFSVGTWTNIHIVNGLPHISYYSDSFNGTRSPIRLAYPIASNGRTAEQNVLEPGAGVGADAEAFTGNWMIMAVPAVSAPRGGMEQFNRVMLDTYQNGTLDMPIVAWLGDRIEYARLLPPQ